MEFESSVNVVRAVSASVTGLIFGCDSKLINLISAIQCGTLTNSDKTAKVII
jgi:hypothetical protein